MMPGPSLGFIGAGVVGTALAQRFAQAGYQVVSAASRSRSSAERLAAAVPGCAVCETAQEAAVRAEMVFLTTPDDAIASVADSVAWRPGQGVIHCSGALSLEVLEPARSAGALVGSFHPLQTFAHLEQALANLSGSTFALEGEELMKLLEEMAAALGGRSVRLRPQDKVLYHAAAVLTSNYTVTLLHLATGLWTKFGHSREEALEALLPLLRGTVDNLQAIGLPNALTGPISRGDRETVARHLQALQDEQETAAVYRALAEATIPLALEKGRLDHAGAGALAALVGA